MDNIIVMDVHTKHIIEKIRETASQSVPLGGNVFLYGSRARGDAKEDSDWDLLVVVDGDSVVNDDYDRITYPITLLGWSLKECFVPILYTRKEWEAESFTSFYNNVTNEAIQIL